MREILFRGKSRSTDKWVFGDFVSDACRISHEGYLNEYGEVGYISTYVIPETVGQYTGLTDKNGKKIFEGDIFLIDEEYHAVVIFEDGCFRLQVHGLCGTYTEGGYCEDGGGYGIIECDPIDWFFVHDMKIVGNIHNNPELLKEGAK